MFCSGRRRSSYMNKVLLNKKSCSLFQSMTFLLCILLSLGGCDSSNESGNKDLLSIEKRGNDDPEVQFNLGQAYYEGKGVTQDYLQAAYWFEKAAAQGHQGAQLRLGMLYYQGEGVERSNERAFYWFERSIVGGDSESQFQLANKYLQGEGGLPQNEERAFHWYEKAATAGHRGAQFQLAEMYHRGSGGVEADVEEALSLYKKAASRGHQEAQRQLAEMYYNGEGVTENKKIAFYWYEKGVSVETAREKFALADKYDRGLDHFPEDSDRALHWFKKAAEQGHKGAQLRLAKMYYNGEGVTENKETGFYWYEKSVSVETAEQKFALADKYDRGLGDFPEDNDRALHWFRKAAEQGHSGAQLRLAKVYYSGEGDDENKERGFSLYERTVSTETAEQKFALADKYDRGLGDFPQDSGRALHWFRKAAEQGHAKAQQRLAKMYYNGEGVTENKERAFYWYEKGVSVETAEQKFALADKYDRGLGDFPQDSGRALHWFRKAAEQGHAKAQQRLAKMYYNGEGVTENKERAFYWYEKGVSVETAEQKFALADKYDRGLGDFPQDSGRALHWFRKAAEQGHAKAQQRLAKMYYNGEGVTENKETGFYWYEKSLVQTTKEGKFTLGEMYYWGIDYFPQNDGRALYWYREAALAEHQMGQAYLAEMYYQAEGFDDEGDFDYSDEGDPSPNYRKAFHWFLQSTKHDEMGEENKDAEFYLGDMYYQGHGVDRDYKKAFEWFKKSADQDNNREAEFRLADMYYRGEGVDQDYIKAIQLFYKAGKEGHNQAQYNMGVIYDNPDRGGDTKVDHDKDSSTPKISPHLANAANYDEAHKWFKKSANQGNVPAAFSLGLLYVTGGGSEFEADSVQAYRWILFAQNNGVDTIKSLGPTGVATLFLDYLSKEEAPSGIADWEQYAKQVRSIVQYEVNNGPRNYEVPPHRTNDDEGD